MTALSHARCLMLLDSQRAGALAERESRAVVDHLASCASCQAWDTSFARNAATLRGHLEDQSGRADFSGLADRVLRAVRVEQKLAWSARASAWISEMFAYHRYVFSGAMAAAAVALVALPIYFGSDRGPSVMVAAHVSAGDIEVEEFEVAHQGGTVLAMAEGTTIWLSTDEDPDGFRELRP